MIKQPSEQLGDSDICINNDGSLSYKIWIKGGVGILNRECLDHSDALHIYNLVTSHGLDPNDYGIAHPLKSQFEGWSRDKLINEICELRGTIESAMKSGFL